MYLRLLVRLGFKRHSIPFDLFVLTDQFHFDFLRFVSCLQSVLSTAITASSTYSISNTCSDTRTYTGPYSRTHTCANTGTDARTHPCANARADACTNTRTHSCADARTHSSANAHWPTSLLTASSGPSHRLCVPAPNRNR
jgi:hypothetical protein